MKHNLKKVLVVFCSVIMLMTTFAGAASAAWIYPEEYGGPPADGGMGNGYSIGVEIPELKNHTWQAVTEIVKYEQTSKYLILTLKAGEHDEKLYISLPNEGGVRIQSLHADQIAAGKTEPEKNNAGELEPSGLSTIDYRKDGDAFVMVGTDGTIVRYEPVGKGFELQISNADERIVNVSNAQINYAYSGSGKVGGVTVEMPLIENEAILGGGERFNTSNQVGRKFSLVNVDTGIRNDAFTYNNVALFHSNRGYSVWFNMNGVGKADIGCTDADKMSIFYQMSNLDFYLWSGMPLENLKKYTDITGTSGVSPTWSYGLWIGAAATAWASTKKNNAYSNLMDTIEGYMDNYGFYPEACYGEGTNSQTAQSVGYTKERGIKMLHWFWPAGGSMTELLPNSTAYPRWDADGNLIDAGHPFPYKTDLLENYGVYQQFMVHTAWYDYSNPNAVDVVAGRMRQLWNWGVQGAMTDYGELLAFGGTFFNGMDGMEMHNFNSYYYAKTHNEAWSEYFGGDYVLFQRSGTAGSQYYAGNFLGDQGATWDGYTRQIYAMINMGASGFNLYGGDMGALIGMPNSDVWNRWVVLSVFSPYMRQHGQNVHHPWSDYDALTAKTFGNYYYFRKNIVPAIESAVIDANKTSNPIIKGMIAAYPYQIPLKDVTTQYLFCDDFLVCPVLEEEVWYQQVALPKGSTWYDLYSYEAYKGGQVMKAEAPTSTMPIFVKGGSVKAIDLPEESLTLGEEMHDDSADEYQATPALLITPPDMERTSTIHVKDGESEDFRTYKSHTEVYTNTPGENSVFTVSNKQGSPRQVVLALGVTAADIKVDGEKLTRLDHMPDYYNEEYGYYVDIRGMTTILLPAGWKELCITKGESTYVPLKWEPHDTAATVQNLLDDDVTTVYQTPRANSNINYMEIALEEVTEIGSIVAKWAVGYSNYYDIEYSVDGENWELLLTDDQLINTVEEGLGSVDYVYFEPVDAKYLRLYPVEDGDVRVIAALYGFEVYAPDPFVPLKVMEEEEEEEDWTDEEWTDEEWSDWEEEETVVDDEDPEEEDDQNTDGEAVKKRRKKQIIIEEVMNLLPFILIGAGVLVAAAVVLLILLLKRKKKKAEEAAAAAVGDIGEESPTDFPNPPAE